MYTKEQLLSFYSFKYLPRDFVEHPEITTHPSPPIAFLAPTEEEQQVRIFSYSKVLDSDSFTVPIVYKNHALRGSNGVKPRPPMMKKKEQWATPSQSPGGFDENGVFKETPVAPKTVNEKDHFKETVLDKLTQLNLDPLKPKYSDSFFEPMEPLPAQDAIRPAFVHPSATFANTRPSFLFDLRGEPQHHEPLQSQIHQRPPPVHPYASVQPTRPMQPTVPSARPVQMQSDSAQDWTQSERKWVYKDPSGSIQGPFSSKEMLEWLEAGYLPPSLLVKRVYEPVFTRLDVLLTFENPFSEKEGGLQSVIANSEIIRAKEEIKPKKSDQVKADEETRKGESKKPDHEDGKKQISEDGKKSIEEAKKQTNEDGKKKNIEDKKASSSVSTRKDRQETVRLFSTSLLNWAQSQLKAVPNLDVTTFLLFLTELDSQRELKDYVKEICGDQVAKKFCSEFVKRLKSDGIQTKYVETLPVNDDDEFTLVQRKRKTKKDD